MPGMQTLAQGQKDLDKICEEIDQICSDKIVHEQANEKYIEQIQCQNSVLMNKQVELTDSIYGVIQYIKEQQQKQMAYQQYFLKKQQTKSKEKVVLQTNVH